MKDINRISILGYMGAGKSTISKNVANSLNLTPIDLDKRIEESENKSIEEIFKTKGELYFRKLENQVLEDIFDNENNFVLALGGGTPMYYDNMKTINDNSNNLYLQVSPKVLAERLKLEKSKRPLIAHIPDEDLEEFIAKHLFERNPQYLQADYIIDTNNKTEMEITNEIIDLLRPLLQ